MYKYKRGINELDSAKQIEYVLSNNANVCLSMSACLEAKKPYNGMYIKNGKVLLSNLVEKIEIKDKIYKLTFLNTSVKNISCDEYITGIDLEENKFEYDVDGIYYSKKMAFKVEDEILCIEYNISNKQSKKAIFKIIPMVTYRDLYTMKSSDLLKFTGRKIDDGTLINLSVLDQACIVFKSRDMEWSKETKNVTNVKHEFIGEDLIRQTFTEDLLIPGEFEIELAPKEEKNIKIYISSRDFNISDCLSENIFKEYSKKKQELSLNIEDNYVELKSLADSINNTYFKNSIISSLPYRHGFSRNYDIDISKKSTNKIIKDIIELTECVRAIDGKYLSFNKVNSAKEELIIIRRYIKSIDTITTDKEKIGKESINLKLWYVEAVNRLLQEELCIDEFIDFVKSIVYFILSDKNSEKYLNNIENVALTYNAIKIYESMLNKLGIKDEFTYEAAIVVQNLIENKFWCEEKRVMKKNIDDINPISNVEMIYTLSLSYPCIVGDMPIKLLDTIFKELYTPYGLREYSKNSNLNNGLIYPKYMAHFVKANLRQNGVTRASQKIAYNLVKELIQDIGKYTNGGIKKVYNEKGILVDTIGYDILTNAEVIRLYDMLT